MIIYLRRFRAQEEGGFGRRLSRCEIPPKTQSLRRFRAQEMFQRIETNLADVLHLLLICICLPSIVNKFPLPSAKHKKRRSLAVSSFRLFLFFLEHLLRKRGDSNPRYSYPYDSLANCWFQPLTHPSGGFSPKATAKVLLFFGLCKYFCIFLQKFFIIDA